MRIVLLLGVVALALYLAIRQFGWLSSSSASRAGTQAAALARSGPDGRCGIVADVRYAARSRRHDTVVDLGRPHPIESLQVIIPRRDLGRFESSPASWEGRKICVTGPVETYGGRPGIVAHDPDQVRVQ